MNTVGCYCHSSRRVAVVATAVVVAAAAASICVSGVVAVVVVVFVALTITINKIVLFNWHCGANLARCQVQSVPKKKSDRLPSL